MPQQSRVCGVYTDLIYSMQGPERLCSLRVRSLLRGRLLHVNAARAALLILQPRVPPRGSNAPARRWANFVVASS